LIIIVFVDKFQIVAIDASATIKTSVLRQLTAPIDACQSFSQPNGNNILFVAISA
jgi:hypothetical protein